MPTQSKKWIFDEFLNLALWLFTFGLVYVLATDNLWMCFFITASLVISFSKKYIKEVMEVLHPIHCDIDRYIADLNEKNEQLEIDIDELKNIVKKLKNKIDEIDYQLNPPQRRESL